MLVDRQINLMDMLKLYLKRWWIIAIAMIIGGIIAGTYTTLFVKPRYTAYGTLYTETSADVMNQIVDIEYNNLLAKRELVMTYAEILSSNSFMQLVAEQSGLEYSADQVRSMISMSPKNETEILVIAVTSFDPTDSHIIAQKVLDMAPIFVSEIIEGGSVKILDQPVFSSNPSSPNLIRNVEVGAILGILFSLALILAIEFFDNKVKDADTVAEMFKYPVLGEIPTMQQHKRDKKAKKSEEEETVKA